MPNWFHTPEFSFNLDHAVRVLRVGRALMVEMIAPPRGGLLSIQIPDQFERELFEAIGRKELLSAREAGTPEANLNVWEGGVRHRRDLTDPAR